MLNSGHFGESYVAEFIMEQFLSSVLKFRSCLHTFFSLVSASAVALWKDTKFIVGVLKNKFLPVSKRKRGILMTWVRTLLSEKYVEDDRRSWRNGRIVCAVVDRILKDLDISSTSITASRLQRTRSALAKIEKHIGLKLMIPAEELCSNDQRSEDKAFVVLSHLFDAVQRNAPRLTGDGRSSSIYRCVAKGMGLHLAVVGRWSRFNIFYESLENMDIEMTIRGESSCCYQKIVKGLSESKSDEPTCNEDQSDSPQRIPLQYEVYRTKIRVSYFPLEDGSHKLIIKNRGEHITGSPFMIAVDKSKDAPDPVIIECDDLGPGVKRRISQISYYADMISASSNIIGIKKATVLRRRILRHIIRIDGTDVIVENSEDLCTVVKCFKERKKATDCDDSNQSCSTNKQGRRPSAQGKQGRRPAMQVQQGSMPKTTNTNDGNKTSTKLQQESSAKGHAVSDFRKNTNEPININNINDTKTPTLDTNTRQRNEDLPKQPCNTKYSDQQDFAPVNRAPSANQVLPNRPPNEPSVYTEKNHSLPLTGKLDCKFTAKSSATVQSSNTEEHEVNNVTDACISLNKGELMCKQVPIIQLNEVKSPARSTFCKDRRKLLTKMGAKLDTVESVSIEYPRNAEIFNPVDKSEKPLDAGCLISNADTSESCVTQETAADGKNNLKAGTKAPDKGLNYTAKWPNVYLSPNDINKRNFPAFDAAEVNLQLSISPGSITNQRRRSWAGFATMPVIREISVESKDSPDIQKDINEQFSAMTVEKHEHDLSRSMLELSSPNVSNMKNIGSSTPLVTLSIKDRVRLLEGAYKSHSQEIKINELQKPEVRSLSLREKRNFWEAITSS